MLRYEFEEVESVLYKQAHKIMKEFNDLCPNKFELDELVNSVWVKKNIQELDNPKYIAARAYWDMVDYARTIIGSHFKRGKDKTGYYKTPKKVNLITNKHENKNLEKAPDWFSNAIQDERSTYFKNIDDRDEINNLLSCLSGRKLEVLKKYFLEEKSLVEIGEEYGIKDSTVCNCKRAALEHIRSHHNIKIKKEDKNIPLENILPEYVSDFEIGNDCAISGEFVLK